MKTEATRALAMIEAQQWLIDDGWLETFKAIAQRENDLESFKANKEIQQLEHDPCAFMTTHEGVIEGTSAIKRGNYAVIPVIGPIFPRANLFTMISGGVSIEMLAKDTQAVVNAGLKPVIYFSSPGGVVEGVSDYGHMLAKSNSIAFVSGNCTSAAYWLASQCSTILTSDTGILGNIGVKGPNPKGEDDSLVSDNAPNKKMNAGMVKGIINDIEGVFLQAVASGRNTSVEDVRENFGRGGVFVGQKAVDARLADGVTTLEALLTISANQASEIYGKPTMTQEKDNAAELAAMQEQLEAANARAEAAETELAAVKGEDKSAEERQRIEAILASAPDKPKAAMSLAMKTNLPVEAATAALADMPVERAESALTAAMENTNPNVSDEVEESSDDDVSASWDAVIKGVAA